MARESIEVGVQLVLDSKQLLADLKTLSDQAKTQIQNYFSGKKYSIKIPQLTISADTVNVSSGLSNKIQSAINKSIKQIKLKASNLQFDSQSLQSRSKQLGKTVATGIVKAINQAIKQGGQAGAQGQAAPIAIKPNFKVDTNGINSIATKAASQFAKSFQKALKQQKFTINPSNFVITAVGTPTILNGGGGSSGGGSNGGNTGGMGNLNPTQQAQVIKLQTELRNLLELYRSANTMMGTLKNTDPMSGAFTRLNNDLDRTKTRIEALVRSTGNLRTALGSAFWNSNLPSSQLLSLVNKTDTARTQFGKNYTDLSQYTNQVRQQFEELRRIQELYKNATTKYREAYSSGNPGSSQYNLLAKEAKNFKNLADQAYESYNRITNGGLGNAQGAAATALRKELETINRLRDQGAKLETKTLQAVQKVVTDYNTLLARMHQFQNKNIDTLRNTQAGNQLNALIGTVTQQINNKNMDASGLASMTQQFAQIQAAANAAAGATNSFGASILGLIGKAAQWFGVTHVIISAMNTIREMIANVREIDTGMTELRKVTDESEATYSQFLVDAGAKASDLGATLAEVVSSTGDFARLGYNLKEAFNLSESATMLRTVGDDIKDIDMASDAIISSLSAFKIDPSDAMQVVDQLNEVGNNFSSSSGELADILVRSSAALSVAGNDLAESIGLGVAGNEVTRDADVVGTALKTLSLRVTKTKAELEEAGEDADGAATSFSALRETILALTNQKVDILEGDKYKSTYKILQAIAAEWDNISGMNRQGLLEVLGGQRQAQVLSSIITNFDLAEQATETARNSQGSALREQEVYLNSIEGKYSQFKSKMEELSINTFSGDFMKGLIDTGTQVINIFNEMAKSGTLIPAVIAGITAALQRMGKLSMVNILKDNSLTRTYTQGLFGKKYTAGSQGSQYAQQLGFFGSTTINDILTRRQYNSLIKNATDSNGVKLNLSTNWSLSEKDLSILTKYNKAVELYNQGTLSSAQATNSFKNLMAGASPQLQVVAKGMNDVSQGGQAVVLSMNQLGNSTAATTAKMIGLQAASMALSAAISFGVGMAIEGVVQLVDYMVNWSDKAIEAGKAASDAFRDTKNEIDDNINATNSVRSEFQELAAGVDSMGRNISLTSEEYARFQSIVSEITAMNPSLIAGYDAQGNALVNVNTLLDENIQKLEEQLELERKAHMADGDTIMKGDRGLYKEAEKALGDQMGKINSQLPFFRNDEHVADLQTGNWKGFTDNIKELPEALREYITELKEAGNITQEEFDNAMHYVDTIPSFTQAFDEADDETKLFLKEYASNNEEYAALTDERQEIANKLIEGMGINLDSLWGNDWLGKGESIAEVESRVDRIINSVSDLQNLAEIRGLEKLKEQVEEGTIGVDEALAAFEVLQERLAAQLGVTPEEIALAFDFSDTIDELNNLDNRLSELGSSVMGEGLFKQLDSMSIKAKRSFVELFKQFEFDYLARGQNVPETISQTIAGIVNSGKDVETQITNFQTVYSLIRDSQMGLADMENVFRDISNSSTGWLNIDKATSSLEAFKAVVDALELDGQDSEDATKISKIWAQFGAIGSGSGLGSQIATLNTLFNKGKINATQYDAVLKQVLTTLGTNTGIPMEDAIKSLSKSLSMDALTEGLGSAQQAIDDYYNASFENRKYMLSGIEEQVEAINDMMNRANVAHDAAAYSDLTILAQQLSAIQEISTQPVEYVTDAMERVSNAMADLNSMGTVSVESFQALAALGPEFAATMTANATGIGLNTDALNGLIEATRKEAQSQIESYRMRDYQLLQSTSEQIRNLIGDTTDLEAAKANLTAEEAAHLDKLLEEQTALQGLIGTYDAMSAAIDRASGARARLEAVMNAGSKADVADIYQDAMERAKEAVEDGRWGDVKDLLAPMLSPDVDLSSIEAIKAAYESLGWLLDDTDQRIVHIGRSLAEATSSGKLDGLMSNAQVLEDGSIKLNLYADEMDEVARRLGISADVLRDHYSALGAWDPSMGDLGIDGTIADLERFDDVVSRTGDNVTINFERMLEVLRGAGWQESTIQALVNDFAKADNISLTNATGQIMSFTQACHAVKSSDDWQSTINSLGEIKSMSADIDGTGLVDLNALMDELAYTAGQSKTEIAGIVQEMSNQGVQFTIDGEVAVDDSQLNAAIENFAVSWDSTKAYIESQGVVLNVDTNEADLAAVATGTDQLKQWLELAKASGDTVAVQKIEQAIELKESGSIEGLTKSASDGVAALQRNLEAVFGMKMQGDWGFSQAGLQVATVNAMVMALAVSLENLKQIRVNINIEYSKVLGAVQMVNKLSAAISALPTSKTINITTNEKTVKSVTTVQSSSSGSTTKSKTPVAPASGSTGMGGWSNATGIKDSPKSFRALVNDGAPVNGSSAELIIRKDSKEAFIANGGNMAFVDIKPGDTILTAKETQEVFASNTPDIHFKRYKSGTTGSISASMISNADSRPHASSSASSSSSSTKPSSSSSSGNKNTSSNNNKTQVQKEAKAEAKSAEDEWKKAYEREYKYWKHLLNMKQVSYKEYLDKVEELSKKYFEGNEDYIDEWYQYEEEVFEGRLKDAQDNYSKEQKLLKHKLDMEEMAEHEYWKAIKALAEQYYKDNIHLAEEYRDVVLELRQAEWEASETMYSQASKAIERLQGYSKMSDQEAAEALHIASVLAYSSDKKHFADEIADAELAYYKSQKEIAIDTYEEINKENDRLLALGLISQEEYLRRYKENFKKIRDDLRFKDDKEFQLTIADEGVSIHEAMIEEAKRKYNEETQLLENAYKLGLYNTEEYYKKRLEIANKYLSGIKDEEQTLADLYMEEYTNRKERQSEYWERALSGVEHILDNEIRNRERARDAMIEPLQEQLDALNEQMDEIEDAQDKRKREHELQLRPFEDEAEDLQREEKKLALEYKRMIRPYQDAQRLKQKEQSALQREQELALRPLQKELNALERESTWINKMYDDRLWPLQQELKALQKVQDLKEEELETDEKRYKLAKAMSERPNLVYREGLGFVYEGDKDAIREAKQDKDKTEEDARIKELQRQIDELNDLRDLELHPIEDRIWWLNWDIGDIEDRYSEILEPLADTLYELNEFLDNLDWEHTLEMRPIEDRIEDLDMIIDDLNYIYERSERDIADVLEEANQEAKELQNKINKIKDSYEKQINVLNKAKDLLEDQKRYWSEILDIQIAQKVFGDQAWQDFTNMVLESGEKVSDGLSTALLQFADLNRDIFALAGESLDYYAGCINKVIGAAQNTMSAAQQQWEQAVANWAPMISGSGMTITTSQGTAPILPNADGSNPIQNIPTPSNPNPFENNTINPDYDSSAILGYTQEIADAIKRIQTFTKDWDDATERSARGEKEALSTLVLLAKDLREFMPQLTKLAYLGRDEHDKKGVDNQWLTLMTALSKLSVKTGYDFTGLQKQIGTYATGRYDGPKEIAITQETGPEAIMHTSKGNFTFLAPHDKVFTPKQTEMLWKLSKITPDNLGLSQPPVNVRTSTQESVAHNYNVSIGDVIVSGANSPEALSKAIINRLPNQLAQDMSRR